MKQLSIYDDANYGIHAPETGPMQTATTYAYPNRSVAAPIEKKRASEASQESNITEIILSKDMANNVQMILPMLAHLNQDNRWLAWVNPPIQLLKQWRPKNGTLSDDIMVLRSNDKLSAFDLANKALEAGSCHAVIVWTDGLSGEELKSLERASSQGNSHVIVLRYR